MYKLGTKEGILMNLYTSQFDTCKQNFIAITDAAKGKEIPLRHAAIPSTSSSGKGYVTCQCRKQWLNLCLCFKKKKDPVQFKLSQWQLM